MQVKIFTDSKPAELENRINEWLAGLRTGAVIKMETVIATAAERSDDGTRPCIVVTIWHESPEAD